MTKQDLIVFMVLMMAFLPFAAFANGGDQRIVEGKYYINLSRAPFTPRAGLKISFLASFADIQKNKLIDEDLIVNIRIARLGGSGADKRTFIFEQDNLNVRGGVLEFPYTFMNSGLHEIFFDFAFASDPQKVYEAPDFLLDVQKLATPKKIDIFSIFFLLIGSLLGFMGGWGIKGKHIRSSR